MNQETIKPAQTKLSLAFCVFTSALCEIVCHYFNTKRTDMASKQQQAFRMCVLPCLPYLNGWGYTFFVLPVWERSMHIQCSREVLGFTNGSESGVRDEHSLIATFTWQVQCLLSGLGRYLILIRQLSDSEELDVISVNASDTEDSPPQSRACWGCKMSGRLGQQRRRTFI